MSDIKISQLPIQLNANVHSGDTIPIVDSVAAETKQISIGQLDLRYQGVPDGGTTQQVLAKSSGADKDVYWRSLDKNSVGLGAVDNTSDAGKPISVATQTALNLKANTSALSAKADVSYVNTQLGNKQDALPAGADGQVLTLVAGVPAWSTGGGGGGAVSSVFGRIGAVTAMVGDYDKTQIGLDQVDNTSDLGKPLSTAAIAALAGKQASLPAGSNGQILSLVAGTPTWVAAPSSLPTGGATGQVLYKISGTNYDVGWTTIDPGLVVSNNQSLANAAIATLPAGRRVRIKVSGATPLADIKLPAGSVDGAELFIQGTSDTSPVTLTETSGSAGISLFGPSSQITIGLNKIASFIWDSGNTVWILSGGNV